MSSVQSIVCQTRPCSIRGRIQSLQQSAKACPGDSPGGSAVRGRCLSGISLAFQLEHSYSRVGLPCRARHWLQAWPLVTPSPRSRRSWRARLTLSLLSSLMGLCARRPSMVRHHACFQVLLHSKRCQKKVCGYCTSFTACFPAHEGTDLVTRAGCSALWQVQWAADHRPAGAHYCQRLAPTNVQKV